MSLQIEDGNRDGDDVEPAGKCCETPIKRICVLFSTAKSFFKRIFDSNVFFYATLFFAAVMYIVDIGSDIKLAIRYYLDRHFWWGGWTTAFVAIPWLIYRVGVGLFFGGNALDGDVESRLVILAAIFNLIPVAILVVAAKERCGRLETRRKLAPTGGGRDRSLPTNVATTLHRRAIESIGHASHRLHSLFRLLGRRWNV